MKHTTLSRHGRAPSERGHAIVLLSSLAATTAFTAAVACGHSAPDVMDESTAAAAPGRALDAGAMDSAARGAGLRGLYFDNRALVGRARSVRLDPTIDFVWTEASPAAHGKNEGFSVRWLGQIEPKHTESYTFCATADDGVRLWIDGKKVIDRWEYRPKTESCTTVDGLVAGKKVPIRIDYTQGVLGAVMKLHWQSRSQPKEIVPSERLYDVPPPQTLREAAALHGIPIGAAAVVSHFDEEDYARTLATEFDTIVPENHFKPMNTQWARGKWTFEAAAQAVAFADDHGMSVKGHTLLYPGDEFTPPWMLAITDPEELHREMVNHITTVASRFGARVALWDVVNESVGRTNHFSRLLGNRNNRNTGYEYVANAFFAARAALGDAPTLLFYNDNAIELDDPANPNERVDQIYAMVKDFVTRTPRVPIDGVGFQFHMGVGAAKDGEGWKKTVERFIALGLKVNVSEIDVSLPPAPRGPEALQEQAAKYKSVARACLEIPECVSFVSWGFTDKYTWKDAYSSPKRDDTDPLYFDERYQKKPAYYGVLDALLGR